MTDVSPVLVLGVFPLVVGIMLAWVANHMPIAAATTLDRILFWGFPVLIVGVLLWDAAWLKVFLILSYGCGLIPYMLLRMYWRRRRVEGPRISSRVESELKDRGQEPSRNGR